MIIDNAPGLGTISLRDDTGSTLDAVKNDNTKVVFSVREGKDWTLFDLLAGDQVEFTKWLAAQLTDEQRAELKASL